MRTQGRGSGSGTPRRAPQPPKRKRSPLITDHATLLEALLDKFQVFLLNRYEKDSLGFTDTTFRVFLPDLHWISQADMERFPKYHFNGLELLPTLLGVLENVPTLEVFQTGDRLDFWRASVPKHATPEQTYHAIMDDPTIKELHDRLSAFQPTILHGNHDRWVNQAGSEATRPEVTNDRTGKIFLTHGHIWDQVERLPDAWKAWAVSITKNVKARNLNVGPLRPGTLDLIRLKLRIRKQHPENAMPLGIKTIGGIQLHKAKDVETIPDAFLPIHDLQVASFENAVDDFHDVAGIIAFGGDIRERARREHPTCRLFVIGHTHHARILEDTHPTGGPLVTMDCGAWIENCTTKDGQPLPSAQFGIQHGNDLRIYQLGGTI